MQSRSGCHRGRGDKVLLPLGHQEAWVIACGAVRDYLQCEGNYNVQKSSYVFKTASSGPDSQCSAEKLNIVVSVLLHTLFFQLT